MPPLPRPLFSLLRPGPPSVSSVSASSASSASSALSSSPRLNRVSSVQHGRIFDRHLRSPGQARFLSSSNGSNNSNGKRPSGPAVPTPSSYPPLSPGHKSWWSPAMAPDEVSEYLRQDHHRVFENNRAWAAQMRKHDPECFIKLAAGQEPEYLWIGCSDSRIPAEQIAGLQPGEAFIHRNIANLVCSIDVNVMAVINYAVEHLHVKHIVVCGHYGCGGVKAAMTPKDLGLLNPWLRNIRDVYRLFEDELDAITDETARYDRLVELNVMEQCRNIVKTAVLQKSYAANGFPIVHGWVFDFRDGLLKDLEIDFVAMLKAVQKIYNLTED